VSDWALPRRGGIELHLHDLALRLRAAAHAADVLTTTPGPEAPGVVRLDVPRLPGAGVACTPAVVAAVRAALARGGYDVVHAHASVVSPAAYAGVAAARQLGVPALVTFHSLLHASARALAAADALWGWARAPLVLTGVSARVAAQLRGALPRARVAVLPNATDVVWWRAPADAPSPGPARAPGAVHVVTAMRLTRKKRAADLALVADVARAAGAPVRVLVAGDGTERAALARAAGRSDGALALLGWQPRAALRALYAEADLFVLPTARESFGIAALEARAAGLPVIARAGAGPDDFVRDGVDGVLAPDAASLARAVATLARDSARRAALADAARAEPPWAFDWARVVARHVALYDAVAAGAVID
jgi:glycosyltransferase involved in cell wall biosynthesis